MSPTKYTGEERRKNGSEQFIVVKSWHTVIIVLTLIASALLSYARLRDTVDDHERRIREEETKPVVTKEVYEMGQKSIEHRLDRIDQKLEAQDLREFSRQGTSRKN